MHPLNYMGLHDTSRGNPRQYWTNASSGKIRSALGKGQVVQSRLETLAKDLDSLGQRDPMHVLVRLGIELPQLLCETMLGLGPLLSSTRAFLALEDLSQVEIKEPSLLTFELREEVTQGLSTCLECLGQPGPHLGAFQCMGNQRRLGQDTAAVLPDQLVQGTRRGITSRAAFALGQPQRISTTPAAVIMVAGAQRATTAGAPARTTADESPQEIRVGRVVAACHLDRAIQAVLGRFADLLAEERRHRHGHPLLGWGRLLTLAGPYRLQGGCASACRHRMGPTTRGHSGRGGRAQKASYRGHMPAFSTSRRWSLGLTEALRHLIQAGRLAGLGIPGTHRRNHGGLDRVHTPPAGIPRALRIEEIPIGGSSPGQELAPAPCGVAPPTHALSHAGPLGLGDGRTAWHEQGIRRGITHGPLDTLNTTAALGACIDQEHVRHLVTRQAIRGSAQHPCHGGHGHAIPEAIQTGTLACGATLAVITVAGLIGPRPIGVRRHVSAETTALRCNRLVLVWTSRCNPGVESDFHGLPPDDAMVQACGLRRVP